MNVGKLGFVLSVIMISVAVASLILNAHLFGVINQLHVVNSQLHDEISHLQNQLDAQRQVTYDDFKLIIGLEKEEFEMSEPVHMNIQLVNTGKANVTIIFTKMPNPSPYWFWGVKDETHQSVFYHKAVTLLPAFEEITLQPNEVMQRNCTWNQKDTDGQQVLPGIYYLIARVSFLLNEKDVPLQTQTEISIDL